jgi:hypothetical protein
MALPPIYLKGMYIYRCKTTDTETPHRGNIFIVFRQTHEKYASVTVKLIMVYLTKLSIAQVQPTHRRVVRILEKKKSERTWKEVLQILLEKLREHCEKPQSQ